MNIADYLRFLGAVLCAACNRWTYRPASVPCPFCPEPCVTCGGPTGDDAHGFIRDDGTFVAVCAECCGIIAENVHERGEAAK